MADEVKRIIMKRRRSGPEFQRAVAFAEIAAMIIQEKAGKMLKQRNVPEQEWRELSNKVGYMASRTCRNVYADLQDEAKKQPKLKRLNNHGEWQRSRMTMKKCREEGCGHRYCGVEQYDDSSPDSKEVNRERREPICCGYDITQAGEIYCCWCENRFLKPSLGVGLAHANAGAAMASEAAAVKNSALKDMRDAHAIAGAAMASEAAAVKNSALKDMRNTAEEEKEKEDGNYAKVMLEAGYTFSDTEEDTPPPTPPPSPLPFLPPWVPRVPAAPPNSPELSSRNRPNRAVTPELPVAEPAGPPSPPPPPPPSPPALGLPPPY